MMDAGSASELVARLRNAYADGLTRSLDWRIEQLRAMRRLLADNEDELAGVVARDMGKPAFEAWLTEFSFVTGAIDEIIHRLPRWVLPERVHLPIIHQPGKAHIVREPLGVVLVIAPWNYPVHLLLLPMAAAIAAGNCVIGKPSEVTAATSAALARLVASYQDPRAVAVVEGGVEETTALLEQRFDHIFYTGNGTVGRIVAEAAARHLTPVTLELGGKSPTIVAADADIDVAARRIAWAKFTNAGQTCVAPDYVLVERPVQHEFVSALIRSIEIMYGYDPLASPDYGRIVSDRHLERLSGLLASAGAKTVVGGEVDRAARYIAPTVLVDLARNAPIMQEEIFGPVLPVLEVDSVEEAIGFVNERPHPLALYLFSESQATADRVLASTTSGGVCVNHAMIHLAVSALPFGGVGESGVGVYHGRHGFETFSHAKPVLIRRSRPDPTVAYPPYGALKRWLLRRAV